MEELKQLFEKYKWRILGVAFGLLVAILIFTIGFFRTLLLALIVGVCFFFGRILDNGSVEELKAFFKKKDKEK